MVSFMSHTSPKFYVQVGAVLSSRRLIFPPERWNGIKLLMGRVAMRDGEEAALHTLRSAESMDSLFATFRSQAPQVEGIQTTPPKEVKPELPAPTTPEVRKTKHRKPKPRSQMSNERMFDVLSSREKDPRSLKLKRQALTQLRREFAWMRREQPDVHNVLRVLELRFLGHKGIQSHADVACTMGLSETKVQVLEREGVELLKGYLSVLKSAA